MKKITRLVTIFLFIFLIIFNGLPINAFALNENPALISLFPLNHYDQNIADWIKPTDKNYDQKLIPDDIQKKKYANFLEHYFGDYSPWNEKYIRQMLAEKPPNDIQHLLQTLISQFDNREKSEQEIGYGENFRPYDKDWIIAIASNMNLSQFASLTYQAKNRAIVIDNTAARVLPTSDPHYYSHNKPGQGYPFDNLQMSAVWAGTPAYVIGTTKDAAWSLIITPDYICWVKSDKIAQANEGFIGTYKQAAETNLAAIIKNKTSIRAEHQFLFSAYIGAVFPGKATADGMQLAIPVQQNGEALIRYVEVSRDEAALMPIIFTKANLAKIMQQTIGRNYGWGGIYFYNDCSQELKNLFAPFGIWLPRHSSDQVHAGTMVDKSALAPTERLNYLMTNGKPFVTIIYIGGHVVLYLGNYPNPNDDQHEPIALTYQNVWGFRPTPPTGRVIVGKAVILPMLLNFPEDPGLHSQADYPYFQIAYLDEISDNASIQLTITMLLKSLLLPPT